MIEPVKFARDRKQVDGWVDASALPRLDDQLFDLSGGIAFKVQGRETENGHAALRLTLELELNLRCQRCLGPLQFAQEVRREIVFVPGHDVFRPDAIAKDQVELEDDTTDILPAVSELDLREVIEEEVLLSLPLAPRHTGAACANFATSVPRPRFDDTPFAVLERTRKP